MHSHILPGIDDGSKSPQMTLELLRQASEQGVDVMVCTPHYYPQESIESFLGRRKIAVDGLLQAVEMADFRCPNFCFGAEVAYFSGLTGQTDVHRLCIQGTRYMLLELPFGLWPADIFRNLQEMRSVQGIIPIIAHLDGGKKVMKMYMLGSSHQTFLLMMLIKLILIFLRIMIFLSFLFILITIRNFCQIQF